MKDQEYIDKRNQLKVKLDKDLEDLDIEYIQDKKRFKIGNIIRPKSVHQSPIKVTQIGAVAPDSFYNRCSDTPIVRYKGVQLTKKLQPYKNADRLVYVDDEHTGLTLIT